METAYGTLGMSSVVQEQKVVQGDEVGLDAHHRLY